MENAHSDRIINYALKTCGYYPLRAMQLWLVDTHFNKANSTMMNIGVFMKIPPEIDLQRLAQAVNDTLNAHDIGHCRLCFHPETNDLCQRFDGEIFHATIEKISDEELERRKEDFKKPYELINKPLYRFYFFETPTAQYIYMDFYHAIMDGTAITLIFMHEVDARYQGKQIKHNLPKYADYILEEWRVSPDELAAGNKFWQAILYDFDETKHLPPADVKSDVVWNSENITVQINNINQKYFKSTARKETFFFLAVSMLTIAKTSGAKNSIMSMLHNGRYTAQERRLMGVMVEQIPIRWDFENNLTVDEFLDGLEKNFNEGMKYRRSLGTIYSSGMQDECATFIFQKKIYYPVIDGKELEILELPQNQWAAAENTLDIEINQLADGNYYLFLDYDAGRFSKTSMEKFAALFENFVLKLQDTNKTVAEILK